MNNMTNECAVGIRENYCYDKGYERGFRDACRNMKHFNIAGIQLSNMAKFHVGQKVRVLDGRGHENWDGALDKSIGNIFTIESNCLTQDRLYYKVEENYFNWNEEWLIPENFQYCDIQEFDIVELKSGFIGIVHRNLDNYLCIAGFCLYGWDKSMNHKHYTKQNIVRVYRPIGSIPTDKEKWKNLNVVWEREPETKEMTVEEISKALGYNVKIVGSEE